MSTYYEIFIMFLHLAVISSLCILLSGALKLQVRGCIQKFPD